MRRSLVLSAARILVWIALGFAFLCHLWAANRGLEMTDEASYLLIALDPWNTWGHGTFHGFLLRPLYLLGGSSVVGLRWIGYALLLFTAWRLAGAVRLRVGQGKSALADLCTPVLMVAAMTCYSAGMRTPCYNWMILVGAILAWSGWLRSGFSGIAPWELGIGLTIAVLGKWGAALVLLAMFAGVSYSLRERSVGPKRREWITALAVMFVGSGIFAIYAGAAGIQDTIQAGILIAKTTGSHGWFIVPKYGWEMFYYFYRIVRAFVWLLPAILIFWWLNGRTPGKWTIPKIATFLFSVGILLAAVRGWWRGGIEQFGKESVLAGSWLLGVGWTVWAIRRTEKVVSEKQGIVGSFPDLSQGDPTRAQEVAPGFVLWGLGLTPFLIGIGTNTSLADYAGQGAVFFLATGILMMGLLSDKQLKGWALVALVGICFLQASRVSSSLLQMYRVGSVLRQTKLLEIGPEAGRLRVDSATAGQISSLNETLVRYGFHRGDPVIGVDGLCGLVYLSGGTSPGAPWFFAGQHKYLRGVLQKLPKETLAKSWVLIRSGTNLRDLNSWWNPNDVPPPGFKAKLSGFEIDPTLTEDIILYAPVSRREPCHP